MATYVEIWCEVAVMRRYKGSQREAVPTNQEQSQTRVFTIFTLIKKPPFLQRAAFQYLLSRAQARPTIGEQQLKL